VHHQYSLRALLGQKLASDKQVMLCPSLLV
jgi:hypothetical protein